MLFRSGNTSASMAAFCARADLRGVVFIPEGQIAFGKLSQTMDFGAITLQIQGDFDVAMGLVQELSKETDLYLMNSINPFRLEGQQTVMLELFDQLDWKIPDRIVVPGGNLGNSSAFGKAFMELKELGLIERVPRLAVINATGANTLYQLFETLGHRWNGGQVDRKVEEEYVQQMDRENRRASTIASAIEINRPVNFEKCLRALEVCDGVVREVTDQQILDAKAQVGASGLGCEPASAASVAGAKLLRAEGDRKSVV